MIKPGHIRLGIDRKVCFEYYLLEKPDFDNDLKYTLSDNEFDYKKYKRDVIKYEASKQLIEVSNKIYPVITIIPYWIVVNKKYEIIQDNQKCKAKVTGDKATIVELIK